MKWLLAALLLASSASLAAPCATGTLYYGNPPPLDACGSNNLTTVGTVPTVAYGCSGVANPVSFTTANYFRAVSYTGTLVTDFRAATQQTIEGYAFLNTNAANMYPFTTSKAGTFEEFFQMGDGATTSVRYGANGAQIWLWSNATGVGKCRYFRVENTSSYSRLWIGDDGAAPQVVTGTASSGLGDNAIDTMYIGNFTAVAGGFNGTITGLRISNVIQPNVPTTDPSANRGTRSPYWENGVSPWIAKPSIPGVR